MEYSLKFKMTLHMRQSLPHSLYFSGKYLHKTCFILCVIIRWLHFSDDELGRDFFSSIQVKTVKFLQKHEQRAVREKPDHGWVKGAARVMSSHGVDMWVMEFYPYINCKK